MKRNYIIQHFYEGTSPKALAIVIIKHVLNRWFVIGVMATMNMPSQEGRRVTRTCANWLIRWLG